MANLVLQCVTEANIATDTKVTTQGVVTFSERSIYLGLGNDKKVLYDGISPNNFLKSIEVDNVPADTEGEDGELRIVKSEKIIYIKLNGVWEKLGSSAEINIQGNPDDIKDILVNYNASYYPEYNEKFVRLPISREGVFIPTNSTRKIRYENGIIKRDFIAANETQLMFNSKYKVIIFKPLSEGFWQLARASNPDDMNGIFGYVGTGSKIRGNVIAVNNMNTTALSSLNATHVIPDGEYCVILNNSVQTLYRTYLIGNYTNKISWIMKAGTESYTSIVPQTQWQPGIRLGGEATTLPRAKYGQYAMIQDPVGIEDITGIIADINNPTQPELEALIPAYKQMLKVLGSRNH